MGGGTYCSTTRSARADSLGYYTKSSSEIFTQHNINNAMNPYGVNIREARDSNEHPNSIPIILALDVTGSMGSIPKHLVKDGLPNIMEKIIKSGIPDPQVLFLGIGDHECDSAPLQVGQFESSDEFLDKWLTSIYLEGGGGGNDGESYLLAWYFAAFHTSTDNFEKRNKKGYLFTIGDEPTLNEISKSSLKNIMGLDQSSKFTSDELLEKAKEKYNVFHIHLKETSSGSRSFVINGWKQLMSDNLIIANRHHEVSEIIANKIIEIEKSVKNEIQSSKPVTNEINTNLSIL